MADIWMTNQQIVHSYQQADDKEEQIDILSQLNACRKKDIIKVLEQECVYEGPKVDDGGTKRGGRHRKITEQDAMFRPHYDRGLNDVQIAVASGVSTTTVVRWRSRRNLPANREPGWNGQSRVSTA